VRTISHVSMVFSSLTVSTVLMWLADLGSSSNGGSNHSIEKYLHLCALYDLYRLLQVSSLLQTLELQESAKRKGHFPWFNCLVLGHTKYKGVQLVFGNP
jgi:hypothetical protein